MFVELPDWFETWANAKLDALQSNERTCEWAWDWYVERAEYWADRHMAELDADWQDYLATRDY